MSRLPHRSPAAPSPTDEGLDRHAHEAFMRTLDPVCAAAADWHTRREDGLDAAEAAQLQRWLAADPAHARAYGGLVQGLEALRALPATAARATPAAPGATPRPTGTPAPARWRAGVAALAMCCVLLVAGGVAWQQWQQPSYTQHFAAQRGQRLNAALPDGSALVVDAATRLDVAFYRDRRELRLQDGQVMVTAAADPRKPLHVLAGAVRISVVGTRFSVRHHATGRQAGSVEVAVEEGRVRVASVLHPGGADVIGPPTELAAGHSVRVDASGVLGAVTAVPVHSVALWRKGLIRFSDTPLAEVIQEMDRYGPTRLVVEDEAVAALRIGGSYEVGRPGELARLLPQMLPVQLVPRGDGRLEVVRAR